MDATHVWVLKSAYDIKEVSSQHLRSVQAPPRKRQIKKWIKVLAVHKECLEDFAGNNRQPGFWMDEWELPNGIAIKSLGGAWECYSYHVPPRNRYCLRNRSCLKRLPVWVTDRDEFVNGSTISFPKDWIMRHNGVTKPGKDNMATLLRESELRSLLPRKAEYNLHPEAICNTPMDELNRMRKDLRDFIQGNTINYPGGKLVFEDFQIRPYESAVKVVDVVGNTKRIVGVLPHVWVLRYVRMKWIKGTWKHEKIA